MATRGQFWVDRVWYGDSRAWLPLLPLTWLYAAVVALRRLLYRTGVLRTMKLDIPVVVVGNLTAGGTGKTPVTIAIIEALRERGYTPGVVSRGYRGNVGPVAVLVNSDSEPAIVGDEPVLIARRCACPVAVHPDRVAAARLLREEGVDVVIADDGLQHYRLARDVEIVVIDAARWFGNGRMLPSGPLREPRSRLRDVDHVLINGEPTGSLPGGVDSTVFSLRASAVRALDDSEVRDLDDFRGRRIHAVAAIGHPQRFFDLLRSAGAEVVPHPLTDHAPIEASDLEYDDSLDVVMTEKDAVKCRAHASRGRWYVAVDFASPDDGWLDDIASRIGRPVVAGRDTEEIEVHD